MDRYNELRVDIKANYKAGFTLMELVVAIGVMTVLSLLLVPNITSYAQRADDSKSQANIKSVLTAAQVAVNTNTEIYVKDIGRLTESTVVKKSKLTEEIAMYSNTEVEEIELVRDANSSAHSEENKYYISPDRTNQHIVVRYNSDRTSYSYDGGSHKAEEVVEDVRGNVNKVPGSKFIIAGDKNNGFYGEVSSHELFTGDELAAILGITEGRSQFSSTTWLKFAVDGKIIFKTKKTVRSHISWDDINAAQAVFGDREVTKGVNTYKVRLMKGANKNPAGDRWGIINHGSEWNRLMVPLHERAATKNWLYPDNVESSVNTKWGTNYTDADLHLGESAGFGRFNWMQETANHSNTRIVFGNMGVSDSNAYLQSSRSLYVGWSPVLEWSGN